MTVDTQYIADKIGKTPAYVSTWLHTHPSLNVKFTKVFRGNVRYRSFEKEEADRVIDLILNGHLKQEFDPHTKRGRGRPAGCLKTKVKKAVKENDFSDPAWWEY